MIAIQNTDAITAIREGAKLSISEGFPQQLIRSVQPVMDMTPHKFRKCKLIAGTTRTTSAGSATTLFLPANANGRKTYLTSLNMSIIKDAACDVASGALTIFTTQDSLNQTIMRIPILTLTAQNNNLTVTLERPLELTGGLYLLQSTFTAGNMIITVDCYGYEVIE